MGTTEAAPIKHWYFLTYWWCNVCGRYDIERKRMYTPKPTDVEDRRKERVLYCGCMDLRFM